MNSLGDAPFVKLAFMQTVQTLQRTDHYWNFVISACLQLILLENPLSRRYFYITVQKVYSYLSELIPTSPIRPISQSPPIKKIR